MWISHPAILAQPGISTSQEGHNSWQDKSKESRTSWEWRWRPNRSSRNEGGYRPIGAIGDEKLNNIIVFSVSSNKGPHVWYFRAKTSSIQGTGKHEIHLAGSLQDRVLGGRIWMTITFTMRFDVALGINPCGNRKTKAGSAFRLPFACGSAGKAMERNLFGQ